jgi:hypothetical protein
MAIRAQQSCGTGLWSVRKESDRIPRDKASDDHPPPIFHPSILPFFQFAFIRVHSRLKKSYAIHTTTSPGAPPEDYRGGTTDHRWWSRYWDLGKVEEAGGVDLIVI